MSNLSYSCFKKQGCFGDRVYLFGVVFFIYYVIQYLYLDTDAQSHSGITSHSRVRICGKLPLAGRSGRDQIGNVCVTYLSPLFVVFRVVSSRKPVCAGTRMSNLQNRSRAVPLDSYPILFAARSRNALQLLACPLPPLELHVLASRRLMTPLWPPPPRRCPSQSPRKCLASATSSCGKTVWSTSRSPCGMLLQ